MDTHLIGFLVFSGLFLLLMGVGIGSGLYTSRRKFWNDVHAREVRERRRYRDRRFL